MQKNITLLDSAKTISDLQNVSAFLSGLAMQKNQWLPYYYAALAQTWIGWRPDVKDKDANAEKIKRCLPRHRPLRAIPNCWP